MQGLQHDLKFRGPEYLDTFHLSIIVITYS